MFGLSTELMTKGKLATLKEIRPVLTSFRQSEGLSSVQDEGLTL